MVYTIDLYFISQCLRFDMDGLNLEYKSKQLPRNHPKILLSTLEVATPLYHAIYQLSLFIYMYLYVTGLLLWASVVSEPFLLKFQVKEEVSK